MSGWYELGQSANGDWWFVLKADNGQVVLRSQQYKAKASAEGGIESVRTNGNNDARYELKNASDGRPFFNLLAANGQVVGTSQMYASDATRATGIESVKKNSASTDVRAAAAE